MKPGAVLRWSPGTLQPFIPSCVVCHRRGEDFRKQIKQPCLLWI